jgi:hypothetical protein
MSGEPEPAGRGPAAESCSLPDCPGEVVRHLALAEARRAFEQLPEKGRSAPLCKAHYKEWKKATKKDRTLERLGR